MKNYIEIAQETLAIVEANEYYVADERIKLSDEPLSLRHVVVYSPDKVAQARSEWKANTQTCECEIKVDMLDSLTSAKNNGLGKTLVLNFANAFRAGGGFLRGARAQEEDICRCSTLYASISNETAAEMFKYNKAHIASEGSDYMLLSPNVVVFRDCDCNLLKDPYTVSVLTAAAPNLYGEAFKLKDPNLGEIMRHKIKNIIAVAAQNSYETLILGAWGCGAFGHDARHVANCFYDVLVGEDYKKSFKRIAFSIFARNENDYNYSNFLKRFTIKF